MIKISSQQAEKKLRHIALTAQGLNKVNPFGKGLLGVRKTIQHLGYLQLDSISVIERAHHHVLYSRVTDYHPHQLDKLLEDKVIFEYWSHAAAFLPIEDFRFSLPYKHAIKSGKVHWYKNPDQKLMKALLARIREQGPLRARDLESNNKTSGWWDWKPSKKALEQLYMQGDLMITSRQGFQKTYDLSERVLPNSVDVRFPSSQEFAKHLMAQQFRCHGLVSQKGISYLRRNPKLRAAIKAELKKMLSDEQIEQIQLPSGEIFYAEIGVFESGATRVSQRLRLISPFDNCIIQRDRLRSLFNYDYQLECYLPQTKRQYGYFSLPILFLDQFVGRADCKVMRKERHLQVRSLYIENSSFNLDKFINALKNELSRFKRFQACDSISLDKVYPKKLQATLALAINQVNN